MPRPSLLATADALEQPGATYQAETGSRFQLNKLKDNKRQTQVFHSLIQTPNSAVTNRLIRSNTKIGTI